MSEQKLTLVTDHLGLSNEASQESILNTIKHLETEKQSTEDKYENVSGELAKMKEANKDLLEKMASLNNSLASINKERAEVAVNNAIELGKLKPEAKETYLAIANDNLKNFEDLMSNIPATISAKVISNELNTSELSNSVSGQTEEKPIKDWTYYMDNLEEFNALEDSVKAELFDAAM